ncbi:nuclear receptor-binding factor 2-like [Patiria miniata]|uniref:Nuclear receptor-binding factor 2 MIT domain-containing protein n=1 Tax=Patiria miniata TaxID=46514 RepID=A0A914B5B0_PATMI|nr:nuclear receptor-binding factor 2-like [Patiria miniata]
MLHKIVEVKLGMDPDSPLNRAHQIERQAEKMLQSGRYDQASSCYIRAADQLEVAIQQTQNPSAVLSLRLQLENLRKQPQIIKKRQQWDQHKQDSVLTLWNGRFLNEDTPDVLRDQDPMSEVPAGGGAEPEDGERRMRTDSSESKFSSFEETDSLLAMIRQHHVIENEQPKYRVQQIMAAFRTLGSGSGRLDITEPLVSGESSQNETPRGQKLPKTRQTVVQELLTQNQELQSHLMRLFLVLESCEQENQKLKETVSDLRQELEECRMRCVTREVDHFGMGTNSRLEAPFSLMDGFAGTPPSDSLPPLSPLSPLHMPDLEDDDLI